MNKAIRIELGKILSAMEETKIRLEDIKDEEQEKYDNLPEGLQASDKGNVFEEIIENLEDAINSLDEAYSSIEKAASR